MWPAVYREVVTRTGLWLQTEEGHLAITGAALERDAVIHKLKDWLRLRVTCDNVPAWLFD